MKGEIMPKRALLRVLTMTCGLLVVVGCTKNTVKDTNWKPEVVLEGGLAPRAALRYSLAEGSTTTSTLDLSISSMTETTDDGEAFSSAPGLRIVVSSKVTARLPNGNTRLDIKLVEAEAIMPEGADSDVDSDLQASVALLRDVGGWIEVDDRGITQRSALNQAAKNPDLPIRLLMTIIQARSSLARVILPIDPVGVGGRWEARKHFEMFGFEIHQIDRYTINDRIGDELRLGVEIVESAPQQTVTFEEGGVNFTLESLSVSAQGDLVVELDTLEASGRVKGRATEVLSVTRDGVTERVGLDSTFQIDIDVQSEPL
jgi:hypothetical protein